MSHIGYSRKGHVGILTLQKEKTRNALDSELLTELKECLANSVCDDLRALIVTGCSKSFCAGADIAAMSELNKQGAVLWSQLGNEIFQSIEEFPVPTIAAVNGYAFGGGFELALACDIRIASKNALFALPEVTLGMIPGFGGTQRLARIAGVSFAKRIIYTAERFDAETACRMGIVDSVVEGGELMATAEALGERIARNAPIAVRNAKKAIGFGMNAGLYEGLKMEGELFSDCYGSEDLKRGIGAFLRKEKEVLFQNR